ncbi:MAG: SLC13 family permease, partial [Candidatus Bathyarchaeia archaeon]
MPFFIRRRPEALDYVIYLFVTGTIFVLLDFIGFNIPQRISTTIFVGIALGTLMFWRFRLAVALVGISLLLLTNTMPLQKAILFMNLDVIIFLVSMMIIVEQLEHVGFFKWLGSSLASRTHYDPARLMLAFMGLSVFTAAFIDEVTSILIVSAMILRTCQFLGIRPMPYILAAVFATNIGSAATVLGNPVGILVAFRAGLTFEDYIGWATPIAIAGFTIIIPLVLLFFRRTLKRDRSAISTRDIRDSKDWEIADRRRLHLVVGVFLAV